MLRKQPLNSKTKLAARGVINMTDVSLLSTPICFQSRTRVETQDSRPLTTRRVSQLYKIFMNERMVNNGLRLVRISLLPFFFPFNENLISDSAKVFRF